MIEGSIIAHEGRRSIQRATAADTTREVEARFRRREQETHRVFHAAFTRLARQWAREETIACR